MNDIYGRVGLYPNQFEPIIYRWELLQPFVSAKP